MPTDWQLNWLKKIHVITVGYGRVYKQLESKTHGKNSNFKILGLVKSIIILRGVSKPLLNLSLEKISLPSVKSVTSM